MTNDPVAFSDANLAGEFQIRELHCQLLETSDGSFSLRYSADHNQMTEPMHSSKGAWSETLEIYEPALKASLLFLGPSQKWQVASIGLGLGYNEILAAGVAMAHRIEPEKISIVSFESRPELIEVFKTYFENAPPPDECCFLEDVYADIVQRTAELLNLEQQQLRAFICSLISHNQLELRESLNLKSLQHLSSSPQLRGCILFDAFSPSSSPDLWNQDLLEAMIEFLAGPKCVFASYASRTVLKKALKKFGFKLEKRAGFAGKREATFAVRNTPC
ncbi:MAG: hypothetical protein RI953_1196 [Pseudomonadota bacterium]